MTHAVNRAFPGKVDTGFPKGNATSVESRALSGHSASDFMISLIGTRSRAVIGILRHSRRLAAETRATAAVEFAALLPFMLLLYIGGVEISQGVSADRKVTMTSRTVADLASRATNIDNPAMNDILSASSAVVAPFDPARLIVTVSRVDINANGVATICWSDSLNGTPRPKSQLVPLPPTLVVHSSSLIWGEAQYAYAPTLGYYMTGTLTLRDSIFMSPRMSSTVTRNSIVCP
jgi:Flp pilus assembly protein TadG